MHLSLIRRRVIGADADFERQRLVAGRTDFDPMDAGVEVQPLEYPVEVVHGPFEVAVGVHFRVLRLDLETQRALVAGRGLIAAAVCGISAVPRVVPRIVITAVVATAVRVAQTVSSVITAWNDVGAAPAASRRGIRRT